MIFDCGKLQRIPKRKAFLLSIFPSWLHVGMWEGETERTKISEGFRARVWKLFCPYAVRARAAKTKEGRCPYEGLYTFHREFRNGGRTGLALRCIF